MLAYLMAVAVAFSQDATLEIGEAPTAVVGAPGHIYVKSVQGITDVEWDGSGLVGSLLATEGQVRSYSFAHVSSSLYGQPMLVTAIDLAGQSRCFDVLGDVLDPVPGLVGCPAFAVADIDGDGFDDLHLTAGEEQPGLVLSGSGSYAAHELGLPQPSISFPFRDLNLDGFADVVHVDFSYDDRTNPGTSVDCFGFPSDDGCLVAEDSTTRIYTGSQEGYLDAPVVELSHEGVIHPNALQPIQYDADPEWELIGIAVTESPSFDYNGAVVLVDLTDPPSLQALAVGEGEWDEPMNLLIIDDEDFDGIDDIVIVSEHSVHVHSSTWPSDPLWEWSGPLIRHAISHDLDGNGLRDLVVLHDNTVHVFWAPFTYELPEETGHTGDKGSTSHTGATSDTSTRSVGSTADTASATDTAGSDTAGPDTGAAGADGPVCGCQAASPAVLGLLPMPPLLWLRRRT